MSTALSFNSPGIPGVANRFEPYLHTSSNAALIRYDIYVDGMLDHSVVGVDSTTAFAQSNWITVFDIVAVDTSGNQSGPATVDAILDLCF